MAARELNLEGSDVFFFVYFIYLFFARSSLSDMNRSVSLQVWARGLALLAAHQSPVVESMLVSENNF